MVDSPGKKDKKSEKKVTPKDYLANLGFAMKLIESDPSLQEFIKKVRQHMTENKGRTPTKYELDEMKQGLDWFERYDALQEEARMQQMDPRRRADFETSLRLQRERVSELARSYGVTLDQNTLDTIALDARLDGLTDIEIQDRFGPILERLVTAGEDLGGTAAEFERNILQWSRSNGLRLTGQTIARYVKAGVEGRSTLEDIKNDLRRTYLVGMYPGWADKINQGSDPSDLFEPYREAASNLLELPEIDFDDPIMKRASQAIGDDGKPVQLPLYQFEQEVRKDPRWQKTNNAVESYNRLADQVLGMFGLG